MSHDPLQATASPPADRPTRLASLDAFRGATVAGMILVNNPGSWQHFYPALAMLLHCRRIYFKV